MHTNKTHTHRPAAVWATLAVLAILAVLTTIGAIAFNLAGADEPGEIVAGLLILGLAAGYAVAAMRLPSGDSRYRTLAITLSAVHLVFNAVVKVGIEGETVSVMFIVLTAAVIGLLSSPASRRFFAGGRAELAPTAA